MPLLSSRNKKETFQNVTTSDPGYVAVALKLAEPAPTFQLKFRNALDVRFNLLMGANGNNPSLQTTVTNSSLP